MKNTSGFFEDGWPDCSALRTGWLVVCRDGDIFGFTDSDQAFSGALPAPWDTYGEVEYVSAIGYTRSNITTSASLTVDNLTVQGVSDQQGVEDIDIRAGKFDNAAVFIFTVARGDLYYSGTTFTLMRLRRGWFGELKQADGAFETELRGLINLYQQPNGRLIRPDCNWTVGDSNCQVDIESFRKTATVSAVIETHRVFRANGFVSATHTWDTDVQFDAGAYSQTVRSGTGTAAVVTLGVDPGGGGGTHGGSFGEDGTPGA